MVSRIIFGLIGVAVGILLTVKSNWIRENVGSIATIEKYMRNFGGTRAFLQILGVLITLGSILYMTGVLQRVLTSIAESLFGR